MISVVSVNWNSGLQMSSCIDSVFKGAGGLVDRFIVVDNNSTDGSDNLCDRRNDCELMRSGSNLGFGKACNLGAKSVASNYLLFLNPDAAVFKDTLDKSIEFMENAANADVGICGVQLLDEEGKVARSCARFPTAWRLAAHALGVDRLFPKLGHFMSEWDHADTRQVDHVIGAFFLVRRKVFEDLNGFDERFFVYLEDLDFSYRAKLAGWRSVYLANAQAFHAGGGTSNQVKARRLFYSLRSRLLYAFKHFSKAGACLVLLTTLLLEPFARTSYGLSRRSWSSVGETWSGYAMLWRWLPKWIFKGITR